MTSYAVNLTTAFAFEVELNDGNDRTREIIVVISRYMLRS